MLTIAATLGLNILAQFVKDKIIPRYGQFGLHAFIFALAFIFVAVKAVIMGNPALLTMAKQAGALLLGAVGVYEILFKQLGKVVNKPL